MIASRIALPVFTALASIPMLACSNGASPAPPPPTAPATSPATTTSALPSPSTSHAPSSNVDVATDGGARSAEATIADGGAAPEGMLLVPGGTFTMGANEGGEQDEHPAHDVTVAAFWLDRTEVTQEAYEECVGAKVCKAADPAIIAKYDGLFRGPKKPIIGVSWFDGRDFCTWKGKRLPREAEFERAVRDGDARRFPWGNEAPTREHTVFSTSATEDVGTHPKGRGPYGHDDLAGNVWEWIEDDYDPLAYTRPTAAEGKPGSCTEILAAQDKLRREGKQGFTGSNPIPTVCDKAIRGGAYNFPAGGLRSTNRVHHPASFRLQMTGFRCAKDAG